MFTLATTDALLADITNVSIGTRGSLSALLALVGYVVRFNARSFQANLSGQAKTTGWAAVSFLTLDSADCRAGFAFRPFDAGRATRTFKTGIASKSNVSFLAYASGPTGIARQTRFTARTFLSNAAR